MSMSSSTRRRIAAGLACLLGVLGVAGVVTASGVLTAAPPSHHSMECVRSIPGPVSNGKAVIAAGLARKVPERGIVIGLAAALRESGLRNLANLNVPASLVFPNDGVGVARTALGILQQEQDWGPPQDRMNPAIAAGRFFTVLIAVPGWESLPDGEAAQAVQRSAYPSSYAGAVMAEAERFYREHLEEVLSGDECAVAQTRGAA